MQDVRTVKAEKAVVESNGVAARKEITQADAERIQMDIFTRQAWISYQDMLVRPARRSHRSTWTCLG